MGKLTLSKMLVNILSSAFCQKAIWLLPED